MIDCLKLHKNKIFQNKNVAVVSLDDNLDRIVASHLSFLNLDRFDIRPPLIEQNPKPDITTT